MCQGSSERSGIGTPAHRIQIQQIELKTREDKEITTYSKTPANLLVPIQLHLMGAPVGDFGCPFPSITRGSCAHYPDDETADGYCRQSCIPEHQSPTYTCYKKTH